MKRRDVLLALITFVFVSHAAGAQAANVAVILSIDVPEYREALKGFRQASGHQIAGVYDMYGDPDRGRKIVADLEQQKPDLIFALGTWALQVVSIQTNIPVVYAMVLNPPTSVPVGAKHVTGASMNVPVELPLRTLKQLGPRVKRIGTLFNHAKTGYLVRQAETVARDESLQLVTKDIVSSKAILQALESVQDDIDALWILPDETLLSQVVVQQILLFSYRRKIPVLGISERHAQMGAVLALSFASSEDIGRQAGELAQAVLKGTPPAQLPYTLARKTSLFVNLKAAQKLGIVIPQVVLGRATAVIE